ncbi:MAG: hypothetical protein Q4D58_09755 [Synergistaceae bacterium]|nr:hypothetical protein [Synergistaceae bacterium]
MSGFFETGKGYMVRVTDLHSPDAETFSVSLNDLAGRYPTNEDVEMPGELINVLLDATVPHEVIKMERGFPKVVGMKLRPRFSVTPVGLTATPAADATLITPGVSSATGFLGGVTAPSDDGAAPFDPREGVEPEPEAEAGADRQTELADMRKGALIDIAQGHGLSYSEKNSKSEIITGILAAEAQS